MKNKIQATEDQRLKQFEALKALKREEDKEDKNSVEGIFPKEMRTNEIKNK